MSYKLENKSDFIIVNFSEEPKIPVLEELTLKASESITMTTHALIIDLGIFYGIASRDFFRMLANVSKSLKSIGKKVFVVNACDEMIKGIKSYGLDSAVERKSTAQEVFALFLKPKIDVQFINPFVEATIKTLEVQCQLKIQSQKPYLKNQSNAQKSDIAAVIGLTSKTFQGSIAICFSESVFLALLNQMLQETNQSITKELEDGAAELLNIIFGNAKKVLNEKNYQIEKAIPTIVRGKALEVKHLTKSASVVLPFESSIGQFWIEIASEPIV